MITVSAFNAKHAVSGSKVFVLNIHLPILVISIRAP
jgi:PII-like signaling protein